MSLEAAQTFLNQDVWGDGWDQVESVLLLELAEDTPPRREAVGAEVEREDLVVVDVGEVGTGDSEEEGVAVVKRREASQSVVERREASQPGVERREASQPGDREEEEGEEGAGVGGSPGRPSSSAAW